MVKKKIYKRAETKNRKTISQGLAIACLIINIFIPGLGSLIGNKIREGIMQLVLYFASIFLGIILILTIIGIPLGILIIILGPLIAWIWGIVTGVNLIRESN